MGKFNYLFDNKSDDSNKNKKNNRLLNNEDEIKKDLDEKILDCNIDEPSLKVIEDKVIDNNKILMTKIDEYSIPESNNIPEEYYKKDKLDDEIYIDDAVFEEYYVENKLENNYEIPIIEDVSEEYYKENKLDNDEIVLDNEIEEIKDSTTGEVGSYKYEDYYEEFIKSKISKRQ